MAADHRASSIGKFCDHSFSQEERLCRVSFNEEPDLHLDWTDSADLSPNPSTEIMIVSLPESSQESDGTLHEDFKTPPEEAMAQLVSSEEQRPVMAVVGISGRNDTEEDSVFVDAGSDSDVTADLGKNSELSAVRSVRVSTCEGEEIRVSKVPDSCAELVAKISGDTSEFENAVDLGKDSESASPTSENEVSDESPSKKLKTYDLGKDSESGFSKENEASSPASENEISGESPLNKLKLSPKNLHLNSPNVCGTENKEAATESVQIGEENELPNSETNEDGNLGSGDTEVLESEFDDGEGIHSLAVKDSDESVKPVETETEEGKIDEIRGPGKNPEDIEKGKYVFSSHKRLNGKLDPPEEAVKYVETEREEDEIDETQSPGRGDSRAKNTEDIEKGKYVCSTGKNVEGKRHLPLSLGGQPANVDGESGSGTSTEQWLKTIRKFLVMLSKENKEGNGLANESILETAQRRGMTFPQPRW